MKNKNGPLIDEEKEKKAVEWENKVLSFLMPIVGSIAFVVGLVGFILVISKNVGMGVFLIIVAMLGLGGIAYGVVGFIKRRSEKNKPEEKEPKK